MNKTIYILIAIIVFCSCSEEDTTVKNNPTIISNLIDTTLVDVSYGNHQRQKYDIHLPAGRDSSTPVLLMIHGGAWKAGQKEDFNYYVNLIKNSWSDVAIVNMNYRLASNTDNIHHSEIMDDINDAIGAVLDNLIEYQISSEMGVIGASAGAQLAMIYAYKYNDHNNINCVASIFGPTIIKDWTWYNSTNIWLGGSVGAILTEYVGQTWDDAVYESVSPYWNISSNSQPTILFHGNIDPIVPVYQSQWMNGKLNTLNVAHEYHEYFAFHSFDNTQSKDVISKLVNFFRTHIN
jgi:acetyl esterase/lipase